MDKKSDIFHSKNYLILNFFILFGYVLLYPVITSKLDPAKFGNYVLAYTIATIIVAISNFGTKEAYKRNFFGIKKIDSSWDILINLSDRTASTTTYRDYKGGIPQDVYRRYYSSCR